MDAITQTENLAPMELAARAADRAAAAHTFADYRSRKAANTLIAQDADLEAFAAYLCIVTDGAQCPSGAQLATEAQAWAHISYGLVAGYVQSQLKGGFAVGTVNRRLATVKAYTKLAAQAGVIDDSTMRLVGTVAGYGSKDGRQVDKARAAAGVSVRKGYKKAAAVRLTEGQAKALKAQPNTPQGRRDALLMALLLDHGLRDSEIVLLERTSFDAAAGTMRFYRPKVDLEQTHKLSKGTRAALKAWDAAGDCPAMGAILRSSRKGGALGGAGMSLSGVAQRVRVLGAAVGADGLSPHDCRHFWATKWAPKVSAMRLQEAGGWASLATVRRYVERAAIANEGMTGDD